MIIAKSYISKAAKKLMNRSPLAKQAFSEVEQSIKNNVTLHQSVFILNDSKKNCNGVVPIKEKCYEILEEQFHWFREKPLAYFQNDAQKGGPIDVYKEFETGIEVFKVGLEFETGNISSAHRSLNKLRIGIKKHELDLAILMMPVKRMSFYLTDRVSNYEELEPYFLLLDDIPFIVLGFDAEKYSPNVPVLPKGKDGMSPRTIRKWQPVKK